MRNLQTQALSGTVSGTTPILGNQIDANQLINMSFQFVTADVAAAGVLKLQGSNDNKGTYSDGNFTATHWSDIPSATSTVTAGVASMLVYPNIACTWVRVVFTPSAGTGAVIVNVNAVGV